MKLSVFINHNEHFLRGEYYCALHACTERESYMYEDKKVIAEIDVDFDAIDLSEVTKLAVESIEKEEQNALAGHEKTMQGLETRKQNLLSITHQPEQKDE